MKNPYSLEGKLALITGGGTGIGFGIAKAFIHQGAKVIITGRRGAVLEQAAAELGKNCHHIQHDINQLSLIPDFVSQIEQQFGPIEILVNNAGRNLKKTFEETSDQEFLDILQTNLLGVFSLSREVGKRMAERRSGNMIMIASMTSTIGMEKVVAYSTSKSGMMGLMRTLVVELAPNNVRINAIAPGWIESAMLHKALDNDQARKDKILGRIPMKKFGNPEDIGLAAVYLASDAAKYVSGVLLPIDGGASDAL